MSQALIAACLALSILTFVISLIEFLPMRQGDVARQESLQYNTFLCLVVPIILAYCSQSRVIATMTQQWIVARTCSLQECFSVANMSYKLAEALKHSAACAGLTCIAESMNFLDNPFEPSRQAVGKKQGSRGGVDSVDSAANSAKVTMNILTSAAQEGSSVRPKHSQGSVPEQLFASSMRLDQNLLLQEKLQPKCLISNPNFDAYSTETDTPKNEAVGGGAGKSTSEGKVFKFPALDDSFSSGSLVDSERNSMRNEERPSAIDVSMSNLMLCHFGQELHDQHKMFNRAFIDMQKIGCEASRTLDQCLPLRELFLQDYSTLEKMLVLINVVLFSASLGANSDDSEVNTAILYIMLAIAYFVTTTTCLSGANTLKRKVYSNQQDLAQNCSADENSVRASTSETLDKSKFKVNNHSVKNSSGTGKKQSFGKRQNADVRGKNLSVSIQEKMNKPQMSVSGTTQSQFEEPKNRKKNNICGKLWDCLVLAAVTFESYASRFLRISFFLLNVAMLWLCVVNLD